MNSRRFLFGSLSSFLFLSSVSANLLPTDVTVLTREHFNGTNMFSVADALEGVPAINLERDGARGTRTRIRMRGAPENQHVIVLLDGRPVNHDFDGAVDLTQIPINIVSRIEITRGGASGAYTAEAVGGAVNIITSRPITRGFGTRLGTGVGRDGTKHSHGRFFSRSNAADITYLASIEESSGFSINEDSQASNHFVNVTHSFNGDGYAGLEYFYQESEVGLSKGTPVQFEEWNAQEERQPADEFAQREQVWQHTKAHVMTPKLFGGHFYSFFTYSTRNVDENEKPTGPAVLDKDLHTETFDLIWKKGKFEWGGQTRQMRRRIYLLGRTNTRQEALYARYVAEGDRFRLHPSVRVDDHSVFGSFVSPRLAGVAALNDRLQLSASATRSFRSPNHDELFVSSAVRANTRLDPEEAQSYDAGVAYQTGTSFSAKVTGFHIDLSDLIIADPATLMWENKGTGRTRGVETEVAWSPSPDSRLRGVRASAHWTVQQARVSFPGLPTGRAALTPRDLGFFRVETDLPRKIVLVNELRYEGEQFELPHEAGVRIPSHYVWNLRFRAKALKADLHFDIENVTRRRYAEALGEFNGPAGPTTVLSPQPERTFWTGISIRFDN